MKATKELIELAKERLGKLKQIIIDSGEEDFYEIKRREMRKAFDLFFDNQSLDYPVLADMDFHFAINLLDVEGKNILLQFEFTEIVFSRARDGVIAAELCIDSDDEDGWEQVTLSSIDKAIACFDTFKY